MLNNLVSMLTKSLTPTYIASTNKTAISNNPFSNGSHNENPFLSASCGTSSYYCKNQPFQGGYFAGYYNGKPNIVGRKLFIDV